MGLNDHGLKWLYAEMVTGRNSLEPLRYVIAKILSFFYQKLILVLAITELSLVAGAIYGFWKRKTVCRKIPNHVIEAVRKIEDRKQIEHAK